MTELRRKYPVLTSVVLVVLFVAASVLGSVPLLLWDGFWRMGEYLPQLLVELFIILVMLLVALLLKMGYLFRPSGKPAAEKIVPTLPIVFLYTFAMLETVILYSEETLQPPVRILWFLLCMLAIGVAEELTFRGLITRMIYEKYGYHPLGVWLSVISSSLLFGTVHIINAVGGLTELTGVLVQMVGASALGMCLAAIYLRTRSLWTVALLHGYMDVCALLTSGIYTSSTMQDLVGGYSTANLVSALMYTALAVFLLRPSQMRKITDMDAKPPQNQILGLMAAVFLMAGLFSAVAVITI